MDVINTLNKYILVDGFHLVVDEKKSQGSWIVDAVSGKQYLDFFSQFASQPLGWNHPKLLKRKDELTEVVLHKYANSDLYSEPYAKFVEKFASITKDFKYFFFIDGGTLGVENALKAAFDYKAQKLGLRDKQADKLDVIHFKEAFHGRSGYTLSLTNTSEDKTRWFPKFRWTRVINPKISFPIELNKVKSTERIALSQVENACKNNLVAAIVIEPIQGEGGDNHFRVEFLQELRKLADKYDVMLIFDEVQTGMGITGTWWCYQQFGVIPDMLCFGKKSQVCGFCSTDRIDNVKDNVFRITSRINSTWGGNIVDMVRGNILIEIIEEDGLIKNAQKMGEHFLTKVAECSRKGWFKKSNYSISNIRGKGLMIAFDCENTNARNEIVGKLSENMMVLKCGERSVRFRPHLTVSETEIDLAIKYLKEVVG